MAQRRLFSPDIVTSDAFIDMPISTQALYFHLGMAADDDGFVNPKKVMRMIGASDDDLKIMIGKRFVIPFESGVVVIKHWLIHNSIRKDRYNQTRYIEEKSKLFIKENKAYTDVATKAQPFGNQLAEIRHTKLSKVKLSKVKLIDTRISGSFDLFWGMYPKKTAKQQALKSWHKINPDENLFSRIMNSLNIQMKSPQWTKEAGQFIPYPATWLNQQRWNDELSMPLLSAPVAIFKE